MRFSEYQRNYIKDNYLKISTNQLSKNIKASESGVRDFMKREGLIVPEHIKEQRRKESHFKKGHKPFNKGLKLEDYTPKHNIEAMKKHQFKKGNIPHNAKYDGHEVKTKDGYIMVRVSVGNYQYKHLLNWEKVNGKMPKGHCLWCLDKNIENTHHSNWECITRAENIRRNVHVLPPELNNAKRLTTRIINKLKKHEQGE